jgi:hypothetical protein
LLPWFSLILSACQVDSKTDGPLFALAEKVREKRETTKIGGDVALRLGLRDREEEIPAHGQLVSDGKQHRTIMVTDADEIILIFVSSSFAYFCLTDLSGKLRRVFKAEPGNREIYAAVSEVQPRFEEEIAFWKTYLGIAEQQLR